MLGLVKIAIIGAGPAGNYCALLLAKQGHSVDHYLEADIKRNYVICRVKFDNYLADMGRAKGAKFHLSHSFSTFQKEKGRLIVRLNNLGHEVRADADILVGADGPLSPVAKAAGLFAGRRFVIGTQIEAEKKNDNVVEFYPYIGCYAWIVPRNRDVVRIGISAYRNNIELFKKFVRDKIGQDYDKRTIENQSGVIPVFNPSVKARKGNVFLVGDAATFVKATSGGGINQSLKAASILAECIRTGKDYDLEWRRQMYRNLHVHLIMHKMLLKFTEKDWNELVRVFSEEKMKKILYSESRDRLVSMARRIAISKPSLFRYIRYFPFDELRNLL